MQWKNILLKNWRISSMLENIGAYPYFFDKVFLDTSMNLFFAYRSTSARLIANSWNYGEAPWVSGSLWMSNWRHPIHHSTPWCCLLHLHLSCCIHYDTWICDVNDCRSEPLTFKHPIILAIGIVPWHNIDFYVNYILKSILLFGFFFFYKYHIFTLYLDTTSAHSHHNL